MAARDRRRPQDATDGDSTAALVEELYKDLRRQAKAFLRSERADHTLQPTALVHEAWVKLASQTGVRWDSREHFLAIAAQAMRRILVDYARTRQRRKRGGQAVRVLVDLDLIAAGSPVTGWLALHEGLDELESRSPRMARLVELRLLAGLSTEEAAAVLGVSRTTAIREWRVARAFLAAFLADPTRGA